MKPTKAELIDIWYRVESEGFGYYMMYYGPDLELLERMGFDKQKIKEAIKLFAEIKEKISEGEKLAEEDDE